MRGIFDIDKWEEIFLTISKNKLRTFLTCVGVFWGVCMLITLLGLGDGLQKGVYENFKTYAINSMYMWPQSTTIAHNGLNPGRRYSFNNRDYELLKQMPDFDVITPRLQLGGFRGGNNVSRKENSGNYQVMGDYPHYREVESFSIISGRFINLNDINQKLKSCVIGERVIDELFEPNEDPIGQYISIQNVNFRIVGVFGSFKMGEEADRDAGTIYLPFTTMQQSFGFGDKLGWFGVTTNKGVDAEESFTRALAILAQSHNFSPNDERAVGHFSMQKMAGEFNGIFVGIKILVLIVGIGSLFAGIIGISNIMLITVSERTKEIGLRKALGAKPWAIVSMIMQESAFLTLFAGYLGVIIAFGIIEAVAYWASLSEGPVFFSNPQVSFEITIISTIILLIAGLLAGIMPASRAAKVNPIIALRTE